MTEISRRQRKGGRAEAEAASFFTLGTMRRTAAALTLALLAACGGAPTATTGEATTTSLTEPAATSSTLATTSGQTTVPTEAPPTTPAGDPAPDFSLELGDGSTFVLSAEQRPLFMVFWAEW
jgi:hypothetical protein